MLRWLIVLVAAVVAALSGVTAGHAAPPDVNDQDKAFLVSAHQDNLTEIQAGQLAQEKGTRQGVKDLGARLVKDHTTLDDQVTRVAGELDVELPGRPTEEQQAELRELASKSGAEFDRAWIEAQLEDHRKTLAALDKEVTSGSSEKVKKLAQDARPIIEEHLELTKNLRRGE